jgi:hypothetical protein
LGGSAKTRWCKRRSNYICISNSRLYNLGTSTAGIASGGGPVASGNVEYFDGTSWTEINDLNTARSLMSASGTEPAGLIFGGSVPPATGKTEAFDGTSWTEVGDLGVARFYGAGGGTQTSAIFAGGSPAPTNSNTEEWTVPDVVINTLTTS